jgi:uncharacterized protein (TIGR03086 family)
MSAIVGTGERRSMGNPRHAIVRGRRICPMQGRRLRAHDAGMSDTPTSHASTLPTELLITLGRDREAVAAATRDQATTRGAPMDGARQLDDIIPLIEVIVDKIGPEQLDAPTPCSDFTVRGVLEHMIGGVTVFAPAFRGQPAPLPEGDVDPDLPARWRRSMADLLDAVHTAGAAERTIAAPIGEVPGSVFARFVAFDGLVHGWDLAIATGQPYAPADDLVLEVDTFARQALSPDLRDGDTFAAETEAPAEAGPLERLVAFSGRELQTERYHR